MFDKLVISDLKEIGNGPKLLFKLKSLQLMEHSEGPLQTGPTAGLPLPNLSKDFLAME